MNVVPCLAWVKRGVAKRYPDKIKLTDSDIGNLMSQFNKTTDGDGSFTSFSDTTYTEDESSDVDGEQLPTSSKKRKMHEKKSTGISTYC